MCTRTHHIPDAYLFGDGFARIGIGDRLLLLSAEVVVQGQNARRAALVGYLLVFDQLGGVCLACADRAYRDMSW